MGKSEILQTQLVECGLVGLHLLCELLVEGEEDVFWWERDGDIILAIHFNMDNVNYYRPALALHVILLK